MAWVYLIIAGGLEVFWSTFMKLSEGFTRLWPSVWTIVGIAAFHEPVTAARLIFVGLLLIGIIGLKLTA